MEQKFTQLVIEYGDKITTTSIKIAEAFGKRHDNVIRDIECLDCSPEFTALNFEASEYKGKNGMKKFYFITRDGFSMLAMGFTGPRAAKFKEAFINRFNLMEKVLKEKASPTTPILLPVYQERIMSEPTHLCPSNRWNIFDQSHEIMLLIERHIGTVNKYDIVDGSIGQHWARFRSGKPWAKTVTQYHHHYTDKRGKQLSNCFEYSELEHFKVWLKEEYKTLHLFDYLTNKYKKEKNASMLARVEKVKPKLIA